MVAATIGFGGANGLSSLATGPSDEAIGRVSGVPLGDRNIESLTATTVSLPTREQAVAARTGANQGGQGSTLDVGADGTSTAVDDGSGSGATLTGSGSSSVSGTSTATGSDTSTAQPPDGGSFSGVGNNNPGGGGQGLVGQILQGLSNPNQ
jgi:hypothetical protein